MKTLNRILLPGSVTAALVIAMIVKMDIGKEDQSNLQSLVSQPQLLDKTVNVKITDFQNALDTAIKEVKALNIELTDTRSQLSTLKTEHENFETKILAQIKRFDTASESVSSPLSVIGQDTGNDIEPVNAKKNSEIDDAFLAANRLTKMDDTLYLQGSDPNWDESAAVQITNNFTSAGFETSQLESVVCRSTLCRIEINQSEENAISELFDGEQQLIPWSHKGRIETIENQSGDLTSVMYITREDHEFPSNF